MEKQRQDACLKFIENWLNTPDEQEIEFLTANLNLIDSELLQLMEELATKVESLGDGNTAVWLRDRAEKLKVALSNPLVATPEVYRDFLIDVLDLVAQSEANAPVIFSFLKSNLDKLNHSFAQTLEIFGDDTLPKANPESARSVAITIANLSTLMQKFPGGDKATNIEIALTGYGIAGKFLTRSTAPEEWASIQNNLGVAYEDRIKGERAENIEQAIRCYENALKVRTREAIPYAWAETHANLGNAYSRRMKGKRADNLERAIAYCQKALQVYTRQELPQAWAVVQNNLGSTYLHRIEGNKADNLEACIMACEAALSARTRDANPQDWAMSQTNLGSAYLNRIYGDRTLNLERAIYCYETALQVRTYEEFPLDWADTKFNLGLAYLERIYGEKAENLERAIANYQEALSVRTREAYPEKWAEIHSHLGNAYCERIKGDRVENFDKGIAAFESALSIYTREKFPEQWAINQIDLGRAYFHQVGDNRTEEIERAIRCYKAALSVLTREDFPQAWASIQLNLGAAYAQRKLGDNTENIENAIAASQAALQVYTRDDFSLDWARIQNNLGNTYCKRISGKKAENLLFAVCCFKAGLEVYTREAYPQMWGTLQMNLGTAYQEIGDTDTAINYFRYALEIFTPIGFPLHCMVTGNHLGNAAFAANKWKEAIEGYALAIEAVEIWRSWFSTDGRRQNLMQQVYNINIKLVQACINFGCLDKAIEYVERSRSRHLVDLIASNDLYYSEGISPELQEHLQAYEKLQEQIDRLHFTRQQNSNLISHHVPSRLLAEIDFSHENRAAWDSYNQTIKALEEEKIRVFEKLRRLDPVLAGQIQVDRPTFTHLQQLVANRTTAILSFYSTYEDTYIFVVRQNQISCHTCPGQGLETLHDRGIFDNWLLSYLAASDPTKTETERKQLKGIWLSQFNTFLADISQRLLLDELIRDRLNGIEEIILIPCVNLHYIPLAALPLADGQYLGDKFLIRYAPSCQILEFCQKRPQVEATCNYGTVEDATEDLPCSSFEGAQIAQMFNVPPHLRLQGRREATVSNYRQLVKQVQGILSSHHAQSRIDKPLESKLQLGDGSITLGQLLTPSWRVPNLVDVFLSCCETNLGLTQVTDDLLTIASGFLCAGARSVVSTLWAVDDLATALFSIFYHQYRHRGSCRPAALQQAQEELRSLTGETLATVYQPQINLLLDEKFQQLDRARKEAKANRDRCPKDTPDYLKWDEEYKQHFQAGDRIRKTKNQLKAMSQEAFPFSHPFYWSAFTCSGLR